jgi:hypothetical protein
VPLGYYWVCVASEQDIELLGWNIENERNGGGLIGIRAPDGGNYVAAAGVEIEYTAAHTAMPSTLVGVVDASMRVTDAPHIFFKVTPN